MKYKILTALSLIFTMIVFTGCDDFSARPELEKTAECMGELTFESDGGENTLIVKLYEDYKNNKYDKSYYCFYWKDGEGEYPMSACCVTRRKDFEAEIDWKKDEAVILIETTADESEEITIEYPDRTPETQTTRIEINNKEQPQIVAVEVTCECVGVIENHVTIQDMYNINAYASDTVGFVGVPVELKYDEAEVSDVNLKFIYDDKALAPMPEKNLITLYNMGIAVDEVHFTRNFDVNEITVPDAKPGTYMLDDAYIWNKTWGKDTSSYAYDYEEEQDWVKFREPAYKSNEPKDMVAIADTTWAAENAPNFKVSDAKQLAGAVHYINHTAEERCYIYFQNSIDLQNINWKPMCTRETVEKAPVTIYGNGYSVDNMTINLPTEADVGFVGYGDGLEINGLTFNNAYVDGKDNVAVVCGNGKNIKEIRDISVTADIIVDGSNAAPILANGKAEVISDCKAEAIINGKYADYITTRDKPENYEIPKLPFTITVDGNYCITRTEVEGYEGLGWEVYVDNKRVLSRNAMNETVFDTKEVDVTVPVKYKKYKIYLSDDNGNRISNTLSYTVPENYGDNSGEVKTVVKTY